MSCVEMPATDNALELAAAIDRSLAAANKLTREDSTLAKPNAKHEARAQDARDSHRSPCASPPCFCSASLVVISDDSHCDTNRSQLGVFPTIAYATRPREPSLKDRSLHRTTLPGGNSQISLSGTGPRTSNVPPGSGRACVGRQTGVPSSRRVT